VSARRLPLALRALPPEVVAAARAADVPEETLHLADEVASWVPPAERRALAFVVLALEQARAAGSTRLPREGLAAALARLGADEAARREAGELLRAPAGRPATAALFGAVGDYKPFILDGGALYAHRDLRLEDRLARVLAARFAAPALELDAGALDAATAAAAEPGRPFNAEQREALRAALARPLTVVTGGPGTGKTALLAGIVRGLRALGLGAEDIALAAPTGRAANRIAESLGALAGAAPAPSTLHRLLGFRGGRAAARAGELRHHEGYPLPQRAVLVDEASMIDLGLMERLARALRPDARLVLLGDADQLPSVDAGAVFRELAPRALRLVRSHRQDPSAPAGASVLAAARAVHEGAALEVTPRARPADLAWWRTRRRRAAASASPKGEVTPRARPADLAWSGFEVLAPAAPGPATERRLVAAFAEQWVRDRVLALPGYAELAGRTYALGDDAGAPFGDADAAALLRLVRHHASLRVLAVTREAGAATSAESLNELLARRAGQRPSPGDARPGSDPASGPVPGSPVMMIRNDYDRGLFNGDQGVAVGAARPGAAPALVAVFPRGEGLAAFPFEGLRQDLRLAWATTVHKAQGAELEHVALVLPERDLPLLSRELVYTALTRARHSAVVVGRVELLALAAQRPLERASGLAARLDALLTSA
jgi:exodeoxyribonuclease V alpha subunit